MTWFRTDRLPPVNHSVSRQCDRSPHRALRADRAAARPMSPRSPLDGVNATRAAGSTVDRPSDASVQVLMIALLSWLYFA